MKVVIKLSDDISEPYAVIYTNYITDDVKETAERIERKGESVVTAKRDEQYLVVRPEEIYMARVEDGKVVLYLRESKATACKRLNELEKQLSDNFMRISKFTIVNLRQIDSVQPSINGLMYLTLKNGCRDSISRKYLPGFKRYLGL